MNYLLPKIRVPIVACSSMGERNGGVTDSDGTTVFRAKKCSGVRTIVALIVLFCPVQVHFGLILVGPFVFPLRVTAAIYGLLVFLILIPLYENSSLGKEWTRSLVKHACGYFPLSLHVEDIKAFDPKETYVFGYEPHNILPVGVLALASQTSFMPLPRIKLLVTSNVFVVAFLRHIWTWLGCVPATRKVLTNSLASGYSCIIVPGGVREIFYLDHDPNHEVAYIKSRKGFVKIAVETGRPLVPVFCFGQKCAYKWKFLNKRITWDNVKTPFIYWGRYGSLVPFEHPMHVVVGKPIAVKKIAQPSEEEVDEVNALFVTALQELIEKYKSRVGYGDLHLRVL